MIPTRDKELETASEQIQRDTAAFLKNGGKIERVGNGITDYALRNARLQQPVQKGCDKGEAG
jgi:hypothetical protein